MKIEGMESQVAGLDPSPSNKTPTPPSDGFESLLKKAFQEVNQLQKEADKKVSAHLSQGEGDIHEIMLAMEKAGLAFKMLVQGRNKLVQAYEELNRIQL